ncbi:MAG: class I SAM-dependent methyltransferase [Polyangiales bacterium]
MSKRWALLGPPLRPCPFDVAIATRVVTAQSTTKRPLRALILGVTPELATLPWPEGTQLRAIDRVASMIETLWPREGLPADAEAILGEWQSMPFSPSSIDVVLGDGVLVPLAFPAQATQLFDEVRRVLVEDGAFVLRSFVAPDARESLDAIAEDLRAGRVASVHVLKWRLAMAIQASAAQGVCVEAIYDAFAAMVPDRDALADRLGWPQVAMTTFDSYPGSTSRYAFLRLAELEALCAQRFVVRERVTPTYPLGERCPTFILT